MIKKINIGIIAFQGGMEEHINAFKKLGFEVKKIKFVEDLDLITHLIIPGGESTVIGKFLKSSGLNKAIKKKYVEGKMSIWGTCAGAILLGKNTSPYSLNLMNISLKRNAYGRQINSFVKSFYSKKIGSEIKGVFIRAPKITRINNFTEILAKDKLSPILCREGKLLVSTFHPELTESLTVQKYFIDKM